MTQITYGFEDFGFAKIGNIRDVRYAHPSNTAANGLVCTIDLQLANENVDIGVNYVCHSSDNAVTGKYVWETCSSLDPKDISPFLPPPPLTDEELADFARRTRNHLLSEIDQIAMNPIRWPSLSNDEQSQLSQYRKDLLDLTKQSGFPRDIVWPTIPTAVARYCSVVQTDENGISFTTRPS